MLSSDLVSLAACMALVLAGAAVQVAVGAGMSVICGSFLILWLGPVSGIPILLGLNLLVSVVATLCDARDVRWADAAGVALATVAGCALASLLPGLSDTVLKLITAAVLVAVALPRPPTLDRSPRPASALAGVVLAGLVTGALTIWTATPGPITPVALARARRSGAGIRRTMQPISIVGYGAALAWTGWPTLGAAEGGTVAFLVGATILGVAGGFLLRAWVAPARVILLVRIVAGAAACLLIVSALR